MKKLLALFLMISMVFTMSAPSALAIQDLTKAAPIKYNANAQKIEIALVFDSNSEKTNQVIQAYKPIITKSLAPEYKAVFSDDLIFKGDWNQQSAINAAERALKSRARMVVCFGYFSGEYLKNKPNKNKSVVTVDQFAIRGFSDKFFNPVQQSVNDFIVFQRLVPNLGKTAVFINERVYNTKSNWQELAKKGFKEKNCDFDIVILPIGNDINKALAKMPEDVKSVYVTQAYNLTLDERKKLYAALNERKIPTFSSMGREDVVAGALLGTSAQDMDKKLAEMISFNIKNVLRGGTVKSTPVTFVEENVLYMNKDTAELIGYNAHIRLLQSVEVITSKKPEMWDLTYVFNTFEERNLDVQRKRYLINAARRSLASAYLHYLPTVRVDLGYQTYNHDYAYAYQDVPQHGSAITIGIDQMLYAPDLVTNIIVKHKKLRFNKAEKVLTEQNFGLQVAQMYVQTLMLKNQIAVQQEYVNEVRSNLAIAKIRAMAGLCGREEVLRWTGDVSKAEEQLLLLRAAYENVKISISKLLYSDQTKDYDLAPLTAEDPAFFLSDLKIIDHIRTPDKMEKFTQLLAEEAQYLAPETTKLKMAIAMKKAEMANYGQKFLLPNARLSLEYNHNFGVDLPYRDYLQGQLGNLRQFMGDGKRNVLKDDSLRLLIGAQLKTIEGGTKIAEIARCKAELNELKAYLTEVNTEIEMLIRTVVNRAIARYLCIERAYKAMFAETENYQLVKNKYLMGEAEITQVIDALNMEHKAKVEALNSQNEFFTELLWVQRGLASVNWSKATDEAKRFIKSLSETLPPEADINVNL